MQESTILILGDSTSMTVGAERSMYPFHMADEARWPDSTVFVNCSLPGITSADACAFFFRFLKRSRAPRAVIFSLGTCDAISSEVRKGRYTFARQVANDFRQRLGITPKKTRLQNRLLHFEWNDALDDSIERPEAPEDYKFNAERVLRACKARSIPVVLVRPKSNPRCPPGIGKGNFPFYMYLGVPAKVADSLTIPDERFVRAVSQFEDARFEEAAATFREILNELNASVTHAEYPLVVANNYAVAVARAGQTDEAESLFNLVFNVGGLGKEIVLFNLAQLCSISGRSVECVDFLSQSYEADSSLYRIRRPYLDALDQLSHKYSSCIWTLDLQDLLSDEGFVDHCHPLPEGQKKIADAMSSQFEVWGIAGQSRATIKNVLLNPELSKGNATEFYSYFGAFSALTQEEIRSAVRRVSEGLEQVPYEGESALVQSAPKEIAGAIEYCLRHPVFPTLGDFLRPGPEYPSDVGRFPELFLVRFLIPYLRAHEDEPVLAERFDPAVGVLRHSSDLVRVLPDEVAPLVGNEIPALDGPIALDYVNGILEKVRVQLLHHLRGGNQVFERLKSTMFWYFRETLRYGSHSRVSMRYGRTSLEYAAEGLAVSGVLDFRLGLSRGDEICRLVEVLEEVVRVHDQFSKEVSLEFGATSSLGEYDRCLLQLVEKIELKSDVAS
jgi:lysophospholipase L1-like esterase